MIDLIGPGTRHGAAAGALLAALAVLPVAFATAVAQEQTTVGRVITAKGKVMVVSHGDMTPKRLAEGDSLYEGDHIETGRSARLQLSLEDGSLVHVGSSSALDLEWVLYAPALDSRNVIISVPEGFIRFIVEVPVLRSSFEVKTRTAITSVQGTDWIVAARSESTSVLTLAGEVAVENVRPDVRGSIVLTSGSGTSVKTGEAPSPASPWPEDRREAFIRKTAAP